MTTPQAYDWFVTMPKVDWRNWAHPRRIVNDPSLTVAEKRAILTSWVSQAKTLPNYPSLRQLKNGQLVLIAEVENALKRLDAAPPPQIEAEPPREVAERRRGHWPWLARLLRGRSSDDDRSDPTAPAPVVPRTSPPRSDGALPVGA